MSSLRSRKLLDEMREVMRRLHYSIHTERAYCDWVKRYVRYHRMTGRENLNDGATKVEAFLTHLAVDNDVAPSTQNQAMNALLFLYRNVLSTPLEGIDAARATKEPRVPVVMTREEVAMVVALIVGTAQLTACGQVAVRQWVAHDGSDAFTRSRHRL